MEFSTSKFRIFVRSSQSNLKSRKDAPDIEVDSVVGDYYFIY